MSAEVGQFSRWGRGARPTRRVREEYRVYFDRNATKNGAKRSGSGGMDRRPNAAWVLPQAVKTGAAPPGILSSSAAEGGYNGQASCRQAMSQNIHS